jgi:hypothetical protein
VKIAPYIESLRGRLKEACSIRESAITIYSQKELFGNKTTLGTPCVGVVYGGMRPTANKGLTVQLVIDVYMIGGDECNGDLVEDTVAVLDEMREAILCTTSQDGRKWEFLLEVPHQFDEKTMAYVQRWATIVTLTR